MIINDKMKLNGIFFRIKAGFYQKLLYNHLLENYSIYEIPKSSTELLQVEIGLSVQQIIDIVNKS